MKYNHSLLYFISFSVTIFLSAFLLFQVQPLIGKYILPWFGGTSFVWITSLLFFQTLLLAGYLYAYLLTKFSLRQQLLLHSTLVVTIVIITVLLFSHWNSPITPGVELKLPETYAPVIQVLAILLISVGLPYFLLSTTSTLLQKWFSVLPHKKSPYPLYALSNAGSLLAIISYPFFIEPFLSLQNQGQIWSLIFIILCLLLVFCTYLSFRATERSRGIFSPQAAQLKRSLHSSADSVGMTQYRLWLFLPAVSSLMLLAGTHQLTQGIAPIPFLWLLPLGLYLLSFILCFSERSFYKRNLYAYCFLLTIPVVLALLTQPPALSIFVELVLYTIMLFSCFMVCHGELFATRPPTKDINAFYLVMAFGSVVGALIVAIIAPIFFIGLFWEFLLGLFLTTLIAVLVLIKYKNSFLYRRLDFGLRSQKEMTVFLIAVVSFFFGIISIALFLEQTNNSVGVWRNSYGTLRIMQQEKTDTRCLLNGKIIHGCQPLAESQKMKPTTYFGEKSIGLAVDSVREKTTPLQIGVIGLGVGTIAAYGQEGDTIKFYELNPLDVELAKTHFTYLANTPAKVTNVVGDGRLSMEKELKENNKQNYHLFIVDAFNDDAIPVHLLTKEAFALYKAHLAKESIIAVHISNTYLDLIPVIQKAAQYHKMHVIFIDVPPANDMQSRSKWAFLAADKSLLTTSALNKAKKDKPSRTDIKLWTDDYSNLFQIFKY